MFWGHAAEPENPAAEPHERELIRRAIRVRATATSEAPVGSTRRTGAPVFAHGTSRCAPGSQRWRSTSDGVPAALARRELDGQYAIAHSHLRDVCVERQRLRDRGPARRGVGFGAGSIALICCGGGRLDVDGILNSLCASGDPARAPVLWGEAVTVAVDCVPVVRHNGFVHCPRGRRNHRMIRLPVTTSTV